MIYQEVRWIRSCDSKLCPMVKKAALEWYRPLIQVPCFMQKPFKYLRQRFSKIPVIVQIAETRGSEFSLKALAVSAGCRIERELPLIHSFSTKLNAKSLKLLAQNSAVKKIWFDREVRAVLDIASGAVHSPALWQSQLTGKGITVAVLDTGIYAHPDLNGRIIGFKDFVKQKTAPYDDNGHGTHVAGDIASNGSSSGLRYRGPAPEANLVGVKVLDKLGSGLLSRVIEGIQWCITNKEALNIKVLNLSLGSTATESFSNDPICQAVEKAWQAGIVVCAAAGNDGPQPKTVGSPGIDPLIITVGALDDLNTVNPEDEMVASFSSRGPTIDGLIKPDVLAPGTNIISLRSPGSLLDKKNKQSRIDNWYTSLSGTSMATPVCSGVVAQLLQLYPALTPDQLKTLLMKTARTLHLDATIQGAGVIDAARAADIVQSQARTP